MKRFLATLMVVAMMISTMVVGTVPAAAAETDDAASKYVTLDGEWHFKNYRTYSQMYQYFPYGMVSVTWEDLDSAAFPAPETWKSWETLQMPFDNPESGGLLSHDLAPKWSESWVVREFDVPADFTEEDTVTLLLGIIDDIDVVYINGQAVAASGFVNGNKEAIVEVPELGGFDYKAADPADRVQFGSSYWQIKREYEIPTSVLKLGDTNEIAIRLYNNNDYGGFYSGNVYALCGNDLAVRAQKGLPTNKVESQPVLDAVEAQVAALESGDIEAFAATVSEDYHNDADVKDDRVAQIEALMASGEIAVEDAEAAVYMDDDGNYWYSAVRTMTVGEKASTETVELCYEVSGGEALELGNWNRCYQTKYASELFGQDLNYSVYLPDGYYENEDKEYPVVWLLHGMNASSSSFLNVDKIGSFMDNLIASGEVVEMVVVMPDSGKTAGYRDSELGKDKESSGPWASQLNIELRGVIQDNYRVMTSADFNGVSGISMGGGGALSNGTQNPDLYSSVGVHMGAVTGAINDLKALSAEQLEEYDFYIDCGLQDERVGTAGTIAVHEYLESVGKDHGYELRDGGHNSAFYMAGMGASMKMHSDHFMKNGLFEDDADNYVNLEGEWNYKLYRKYGGNSSYGGMFQVLAWGMSYPVWEDLETAVYPTDGAWKDWDSLQMPNDNPELGGLLDNELSPTWSEGWVVREFDLPMDFANSEEVTLLMGIIDDNDVIYINGTPVAASGFVDGNGSAIIEVPEIGGFDYAAADKADQVKWDKSYWEIQREYTIPADVLNLGGTNEIAVRLYNNNSNGGFYAGNLYAICGNNLAVRNVKGLPINKVESPTVMAAVEAQIAAIEACDIEAFAATVADNYHNDADTKADRVAEVSAKFEEIADYPVDVVDADGVIYKDEDGNYWYSANRTFHVGESYYETRQIELCYKVSGGEALEIGNWNRCYGTSYASELFGEDLTYSVYLPPSYYTDTEKEYPVVWLLHGRASSSTSYRDVDDIGAFMDAQIADGNIVEMVLIMPDSGKYAFYEDSELKPGDKDNSGPWRTQLTSELRSVAQKAYRIKKDAKFNGLTGNSMGGYGSIMAGTDRPDLYSSIGLHMAYLPEEALESLKRLHDGWGIDGYDFYLDCGLQDQTVGTGGTIAVHEYLESVGKDHGYDLRNGTHGSAFYMSGMGASMKMHSDHFVAKGLFSPSTGGTVAPSTPPASSAPAAPGADSSVTKNEDGSTTTVTTDQKTGEVTETNKTADGVTGTVVTDKDGAVTEVAAKIPAAAAKEAEKSGESITVPVEVEAAPADEAVEVKVDIPASVDEIVVEIPVTNVEPGTVVVVVKADGTEEVLKTSGISEDGVVVTLEEDVTIKVVDAAKDFDDVKSGDWFSDAADFASARGLMNGVGNDTFAPAVSTTRSMIAQILHSMENNPDAKNAGGFTDVQDDHWFADAAAWAAEKGIVSGYPDGSFGGDDPVTREQLAVMLWRYAGSEDSDHNIGSFKDSAKVSDYATSAIRWAVEMGLLSGKGNGNLDPQGLASRAEVAAVLMSYFRNVMY